MSVYPKGRYWHYDFVYKGRRYHGSTGQETRRNAEAVERAKRLEAATGAGQDAGDLTLDVAVSRYFDEVNHTLAEAVDLQRRINVVLDCVGKGKLLREIDTATIADAIRKRRKYPGRTPAPATVNRDLIDHTLRPLLNRARKVWGIAAMIGGAFRVNGGDAYGYGFVLLGFFVWGVASKCWDHACKPRPIDDPHLLMWWECGRLHPPPYLTFG